ncbi:TRAF-like family protein [Euphorbia peplus]|nr:TRAF-like family protein [Euphorbia peplus]
MTVIHQFTHDDSDPIPSSQHLRIPNEIKIIQSQVEMKRSNRDAPPSHFTLKIKSFSLLPEMVKKTDDKYESAEFEADGYRWKLVLYPNGNTKRNGEGHISLYLALADMDVISNGHHIEVELKFFVYDHIQDNYLVVNDGKIKRYHVLNTENGFDQLLPHSTFNDSRSGYLIDDCCLFGVEVHVIESTLKGEELSIIKEPENGSLSLKIESFSSSSREEKLPLEDKPRNSQEITSVGGNKWKWLAYGEVVPQLLNKLCSWK